MSRATQWQPLCESDPTPGDAHEIQRAGKHYSDMATEIEDQVGRLNDIVSGTLQGGYVESLTTAADGLKDGLGQTSGRYREVGGTLNTWGRTLGDFQDEAEALRVQAVAAQDDLNANRVVAQVAPVGAAPPSDAVVAVARARAARYDDAGGDLSRAQARLSDLTERRDAAARAAADEIRERCQDGVRDSPWDNFMDWMDEHHDLVSSVCRWLGVVAMAACVLALFVPGLNILAGIALAAGSASLLGHSALAVSGNGSWVDVGIDVVSLATFGAGRFLGPGVKVLGKEFGGALGRLTAETKTAGAVARGNVARGPVQARVNADIAQARLRLVGGVSRRAERAVASQVRDIRAAGIVDGDQAFNAARDAYAAQQTKVSVLDNFAYGGGDPELAQLYIETRDAALGFSEVPAVAKAAAKAAAQYTTAVRAMGTSTLLGVWGVVTDSVEVKPYNDWKDQWPTKVKGPL
jgi:hypothetical protein